MQQSWDFDPNNPAYQVKLLAQRVDQMSREKDADEKHIDDLEKRVASMEKTFQRGAGALLVLPFIGTIVGMLIAYGKVLFAPWIGKP